MANTLRIKRRASGGAGAPGSLANAELAFNEVDNVLYYGKGTGGAGGSATTIDAIGGTGAFLALSGTQTASGTYTFSNTITGSVSGNAGTVTDGLYSTGSYADPTWLTSLAASKITGTLAVANGGTGQSTYTNGQLLIGNTTGNTLTKATLTAGAGISITNGNGSITIANSSTATVSSVALTVPTGLAVSGSPITTSGTLAVTMATGYAIPTTASQTNWDTAYTDRNKWDGGATGLTASTGRTSLGATTVGSNLFTLTNPTAVTFLRVNADNTVSTLDAATFRTAIGAGTGNGTVTSVTGTGTVSGLTLSGTVSTTGSLTLGGTLSGIPNTALTNSSITINGTATALGSSISVGTVTSVAALTLVTTGTDVSSTVATGTTTPVITLSIPTASATNRGALSAADWTTFNNKTSNTGTVTSVTGTGTVSGLTLSGTVSTSGSLTLGGTLSVAASNFASQTANTVLAAPNGSAGVPTFRVLAAADIPTLTASKISDFDTQVRTSRLDQMAAPTASVSLNSQKITGLATPTLDTDAANKQYVDSVAQGLDAKQSVVAASTANITTLSGLLTIDGITLVAGDRVLVKNQTTQSQNGIYTASASAWTRAVDMSVWSEIPNAFTFVEGGSTQADTGWVCTSAQGGTLDTTAITWTQFSGAGTYTASTGLTLTGSAFSITNSGVTATSYGSASAVGTFTVNAQGQITTAASTAIAISNTQVSGLGTMSTQAASGVAITGGSITNLTTFDGITIDGGTF